MQKSSFVSVPRESGLALKALDHMGPSGQLLYRSWFSLLMHCQLSLASSGNLRSWDILLSKSSSHVVKIPSHMERPHVGTPGGSPHGFQDDSRCLLPAM